MATKLTKDVTRETNVRVQGRELIVTLKPNGTIVFREKGRRTGEIEVLLEACWSLGVKQKVAADKAAKKAARKTGGR